MISMIVAIDDYASFGTYHRAFLVSKGCDYNEMFVKRVRNASSISRFIFTFICKGGTDEES